MPGWNDMSNWDNLPKVGTVDEALAFMKSLHEDHDSAALADLTEDEAVIYAVDGGRLTPKALLPIGVYREIHARTAA